MQRHRTRINRGIRAPELRVIGQDGTNHGVLPLDEALALAESAELDLIEISPDAKPPVAKIADYGKFQYDEKKKQKAVRGKTKLVEVKNIQVKIATSEHDLALKARKASGWLKEGHRVKVELYLTGRSKYMDRSFLETRLNRVLNLVAGNFKIADQIRKGPKGLSLIIERQ